MLQRGRKIRRTVDSFAPLADRCRKIRPANGRTRPLSLAAVMILTGIIDGAVTAALRGPRKCRNELHERWRREMKMQPIVFLLFLGITNTAMGFFELSLGLPKAKLFAAFFLLVGGFAFGAAVTRAIHIL